jgi:hypothetical protein
MTLSIGILGGKVWNRRTGAIRQATGQGTPSTCQKQRQPTLRTARDRERPEYQRAGGLLSPGTAPRSLPVACYTGILNMADKSRERNDEG